MKRFIFGFIVLSAVLCATSAHAQFRYGPMVGANITDLSFSQELITVDQSVGYSAGVFGEMMFPGIGFGVDIGLQYSQRGATLNLGEQKVWASDGYGKERAYLHYIDIPLNLRFKYTNLSGLEDYVAPFIFGGPTFSLLVAHGNIDALKYSGGEVGLSAGFGVELFRNWQVAGSYTWGMTYALKTVKLDDFSAKNRTWKISVAYLF